MAAVEGQSKWPGRGKAQSCRITYDPPDKGSCLPKRCWYGWRPNFRIL